jgi:endonuclease/exonuclease/phosphatase family metal-dependent hydrolase
MSPFTLRGCSVLAFSLGMLASPNLVSAASTKVPDRTDSNVLVASYNIQFLGQRKHDLQKLAEVISRFDVCGIQEVKDESEVVRLAAELEKFTGKDWGYVFGIRTHRPSGMYHEAYAAVYRTDRVRLGDGVVSNIWDLEEAYRNDPFTVSFKAGNFDFSLLLVHTRWTDDDEGNRANEVRMLAEHVNWMRGFLPEEDIIVAGDFNYAGLTPPMKDMAEEADLIGIDPNEKTTFKKNYSGYASPYDHIFVPSATAASEWVSGSAGVLDATTVIYGSNSKANMKKSKRELSDHLPVWAEFRTDLPDDD